MVQVTRRENESSIALIRRFSRRVQRAGIILEARKSRFRSQKQNKNERRKAAQRREKIKKERKRLYKLGKLDAREFSS